MDRHDITGLHHIGLIVPDMSRAMATFERLGFYIGPPAYPALPPAPGEAPEPVGAGNTHADFPRSFIELVALAPQRREQLPTGANLVPLAIPEEHIATTRTAIRQSIANLATRLELYEGAHILVFATRDAEQTAARLSAAGVGHGGARAAQRPIATADGPRLAAIKFLEINDDDPATPIGLVPEGRVGAAEDASAELLDAQLGLRHPNGATGLVECVLCVDKTELRSTVERYERYLGIVPSTKDAVSMFGLGAGRLVITTAQGLRTGLPGEQPGTAPRLSAYTVEVTDLAETERYLRARGVVPLRGADGQLFIPASAAHGAAIVLRQAAGGADPAYSSTGHRGTLEPRC